MGWLRNVRSPILLGLVRSGSSVCVAGRPSTIVERRLRLLRVLAMHGCSVASRRSPLRLRATFTVERFGRAPLAASGLGNVRHHLHATRNNSSGATAASSICRCSRTTESLRQLLNQGAAHVVCCDVNSISNTENDQRTLRGQRQARIRGIETSSRGLLDFADAHARFANDGADEDVGNKQAEGIRLGLGGRGRVEVLVVEGADDETESLRVVSSCH